MNTDQAGTRHVGGSRSTDARNAFRLAVGCAAIVLALCCAADAFAAPTVSLKPAFSPSAHLGEPTALTAELKIAGTEYGGFPEPLTKLSLRLPAGTVLSSEGFATCSASVLEQKGPAGCPTHSKAGPAGSFNAIVAFGTTRIAETGTTETFFEVGGGFLLYLHAISPVSIEVISRGVFEPASAPFGPAVNFKVPLIETVPGAPDASFTALTLGLGAFYKKGPQEIGSVTVPEACPKGTLSWRADTTFNDQTGVHEMTAHAEAETACPAAGTRIGTTTQLTASNVSPAAGEPVTYTATVAAKTSSLSTPTGTVEFLDSGAPIAGCEAVTVVPAAPSSTATCHATPEIGAHTITAVYQGDSNFLRSEAAGLIVTVSVGSGEEAKRKAEEEASKKRAEEEAAKKHQEEQAAATKRQEEEAAVRKQQEQSPAPLLARRQTTRATSGTATVRLNGTSTFSPLSGSISIPDGSEVDATNGRVVITVATPTGKTVSAEVYGGRFRVHQDSSGETHFILTLPLTGCPKVALPHGSAASLAKHSGPKSRHLWVSETGGGWGTNGRYVATTVQGTTWLTLDECTRSQVKVTAGKVKVLDLVRRKTKMVTAGHSYVAATQRRRHA
jgi:Bacterial Ig-like domain (group 3)